MRKPYFPSNENAPLPLRVTVERRVRFEEVDPLAIVWHGRYASYFEDARNAIGEKYGIGYIDFHGNGVVAPVRIMHIDYHLPLGLNEIVTIEGVLHWTEAARINMEFIIRNSKGIVSTTGFTVQVFLDGNNELLLMRPPFYREFCEKWRTGQIG
ncbi:MAG: acyl-CoA thioesterase [Syntrophus sp. (in: bacteria)]|nr:acyl-CoA thioesterase [Syntrophus sp. (in: bacteria)]